MWLTYVRRFSGVGITTTYRVHECLDIFDTEAEGDDHGDSEDTVESDAPHHGLWKFFGCILQFFAHVGTGVRPIEELESQFQRRSCQYSPDVRPNSAGYAN